MPNATFHAPVLTTFCRLDDLGLVVTGQHLQPDRAVLACRVVDCDDWCQVCGCQGILRDTVVRRLAHLRVGLAAHDVACPGPPASVRRLRSGLTPRHIESG